MEKYDVSTTGTGGGGGEYPLQDGFGWTNGVTLKMLDLICPKEQPCDNVPATRPLSESTTQPVKQKRRNLRLNFAVYRAMPLCA